VEGQTAPRRQNDRTTRNTQHKADVAKLQNGAALLIDDSDQYDHDRDHQQNVYEATHGVRGNYSQQPQNEHDDSNGIKHDLVLSFS
jgi:hypothetical protein